MWTPSPCHLSCPSVVAPDSIAAQLIPVVALRSLKTIPNQHQEQRAQHHSSPDLQHERLRWPGLASNSKVDGAPRIFVEATVLVSSCFAHDPRPHPLGDSSLPLLASRSDLSESCRCLVIGIPGTQHLHPISGSRLLRFCLAPRPSFPPTPPLPSNLPQFQSSCSAYT